MPQHDTQHPEHPREAGETITELREKRHQQLQYERLGSSVEAPELREPTDLHQAAEELRKAGDQIGE